MPVQITEQPFLEQLAPGFTMAVPRYLTAEAGAAKIREAMDQWGGRALVKPDVRCGSRGKAGAVREVTDHVQAEKELKRVQGLEVNGRLPRTA